MITEHGDGQVVETAEGHAEEEAAAEPVEEEKKAPKKKTCV